MQTSLSQFFSAFTRSKVAIVLLFMAVGFAIYAPSFGNRFLLDDESQVLQNILIHSPGNIGVFFLGSTMHQESNTALGGIYYKPMMSLIYSLLWWSAPGDPVPYHLFQLLLIIANALLVWSFFRRCLSELMALMMALLFLVHPLNTEVVVYIADLQDGLYTFFGLAALNLLADGEVFILGRAAGFAALLLGSLLSKESGILYLVISIVYAAIFKVKLWKSTALASLMSLSVYLYLRLGVAHLTVLTYKQNQIGRAPFGVRILTAPLVLASYLWKFIFPRDITATQDWVINQATWNEFWLPLFLVSVVLTTSVWYAIRCRIETKGSLNFAFFTFWVFMGMGFHSHVIVSLDGTVADRWFYFSSIGLVAMIGLFLDRLLLIRFPRTVAALLVALLVSLGVRSLVRSLDWFDNYTICLHDLHIFADSYDMHNNLGVELFRRGKVDEAKAEFERSVSLAPDWDINWNNLGSAYNRQGDKKMAEESYLKSMGHGAYYMAFENYAGLLVSEGRIDEARKFITDKALPMFPASRALQGLLYTIERK